MTLEPASEHNIEPAKKAHIITPLKYPLPAAAVSFERHPEIWKAYVAASKDGKQPVSYSDFGNLTVSPANVSGNNKFFEHLNLISKVEGELGKYLPTLDAIEICRDLTWKRDDKVRSRLAKLVSRSWFGESAKTLLAIREKVTEDELVKHLGYDSGADPRKHARSLKTLVEYLKFSELLKTEDGFLFMSNSHVPPHTEVKDLTESPVSIHSEPVEQTQRSTIGNPQVLLGVLVTPENSEEQIRKVIRILLEEIPKK